MHCDASKLNLINVKVDCYFLYCYETINLDIVKMVANSSKSLWLLKEEKLFD